jgi:TldD protein
LKTSALFCTIACLGTSISFPIHMCFAQIAKDGAASPVLTAAKTELDRNFEELKKQTIAPYYLSFEITDSNTTTVSSTFGALVHSNSGRRRVAHIDVRVGDYTLDNTHQVRGKVALGAAGGVSIVNIPIEDDPLPIRAALWIETDKRYRRALTQLAAVQTNNQVAIEQEDKSADFSHEKPEQAIEPIPEMHIDRKLWEEKARKYTAPFHRYGDLYNATATLIACGGDLEARGPRKQEPAEMVA